MITIDQYLMGRDEEYPLTVEQALNAADLLAKVNWLLCKFGIKTKVTSGYRPGLYNVKANGAQKSAHLMCMAIDLADPSGVIASVLKNNVKSLEDCGLWMENPSKTNGWVHLDTRQRVNRIFNP